MSLKREKSPLPQWATFLHKAQGFRSMEELYCSGLLRGLIESSNPENKSRDCTVNRLLLDQAAAIRTLLKRAVSTRVWEVFTRSRTPTGSMRRRMSGFTANAGTLNAFS